MARERKPIPRKEYIEDLAFQIREISEDSSDVFRQVMRLWEWQNEHKLMGDEKVPEIVTEALAELHKRCSEMVQATGSLERLMDWLDPPDRPAIKRPKRS